MKNLFIYLFAGLLATMLFPVQAQTIRRCNNNPGVTGPNVYSTIQAAHDAAVNGDVIYIEPSSVTYGTLSCAKRLTIYGRGYYFDQTADKTNLGNTNLGNITFGNGSNNSVISGVVIFDNITFTGAISGITIERSYINGGVTFNSTCAGANSVYASNCTIKQCVISNGGVVGTCGTIENNTSGVAIVNCVLWRSNVYTVQYLNNALISNSTIVGGIRNLANSIVVNSLIFNSIDNNVATTFTNNINSRSNLPNGNGNVNGVAWNTLFVKPDPQYDADYQLSSGSSARGTGTNGTDMGAFGGPNPYIPTGLPPIPLITNLVSSPSGNNSTPLTVKISVRSNN